MNAFQWTVLSGVAVLLVWQLKLLARRKARPTPCLLRSLVFLAMGVAIARPSLIQGIAQLFGIGRGTDIVLYLLVFVFLGTSFYFYSRCVQLQQGLTELVRLRAIDNASRSGAAAVDEVVQASGTGAEDLQS